GGAADAASYEAYLRSLELVVRVRKASSEDVARVAQLTQKTNQFNITTIRRSEAEIAALVPDERARVWGRDGSDRFGGYGLTGVPMRVVKDAESVELDTFLMSCRVLGRGVETAILSVVAEEAKRIGARRIAARFVPTAKNAPAKEFLPAHHFEGSIES